ncbi:hypothetical protein A3726_35215 [Erythrobacter sp. HI0037]|nr:hypothetical protein A3726_35215 [Erythrobacter sp. HI0037]KZY21959.1 hypothetical protein A3727_22265 [Erythrobacter sp. HI0038]
MRVGTGDAPYDTPQGNIFSLWQACQLDGGQLGDRLANKAMGKPMCKSLVRGEHSLIILTSLAAIGTAMGSDSR